MKDRFDWAGVARRASTWLAILSAAATAGLGAYALMPERAQSAFPEWTLIGMGALAVGSAFLVPVATSFRQKPKTSGGQSMSQPSEDGDAYAWTDGSGNAYWGGPLVAGVHRQRVQGVLAVGDQVALGPFLTNGGPRRITVEVMSDGPTSLDLYRAVGDEPDELWHRISDDAQASMTWFDDTTPTGAKVQYRAVLCAARADVKPVVSIASVEGEA